MRRLLLTAVMLLVGCGGDDGPDAPLVWTWSFVDPATHAEVGCPANVSNVLLAAYQDVMVGECTGAPRPVAEALFACTEGRGTLAPPPKSQPCDIADRYVIRLIAGTDDDHAYVDERQSVTLAPTAEGHSDIDSPRGFIRLVWNLVESDGVTPATCPANTYIPSLDWRSERWPCDAGSAVLAGRVAGSYDLDVSLLGAAGSHVFGSGRVTGATVTAGAITDAAMTITLE